MLNKTCTFIVYLIDYLQCYCTCQALYVNTLWWINNSNSNSNCFNLKIPLKNDEMFLKIYFSCFRYIKHLRMIYLLGTVMKINTNVTVSTHKLALIMFHCCHNNINAKHIFMLHAHLGEMHVLAWYIAGQQLRIVLHVKDCGKIPSLDHLNINLIHATI